MRFLVSSSNLLKQVRLHRPHERVSITIENQWCTLLSPEGKTELPVEGHHNLMATVNTQKLFAALLSIEDQPITLDLHSWPNAHNILHAYKVHRHADRKDEFEPIMFDL